jgi:hypothetical protein
MQELIDELEEVLSVSFNPLISMNLRLNIDLAKSKLEKEEKFIVDVQNDALQTDFYVNYENPQDYYNQKFKQ